MSAMEILEEIIVAPYKEENEKLKWLIRDMYHLLDRFTWAPPGDVETYNRFRRIKEKVEEMEKEWSK